VDLRIAGGPVIFPGFNLNGVLNLFGYKIKANIIYSPSVSLTRATMALTRLQLTKGHESYNHLISH